MLVGDKVSYDAVKEAYCLLASYIREEGKIGAKYNKEHLFHFNKFLAEILKHPENFVGIDRKKKDRHADGSEKLPDVGDFDGAGVA